MISGRCSASTSIGVLSLCLLWTTAASGAEKARAAGWPRWRGANGDCVVADGTRIAVWPAAGPLKVWESAPIPSSRPGGDVAGVGSVVVSGDRVYAYVTCKVTEPIATRTYAKKDLPKLGWYPVKLPDALNKSVEQARVSPGRAALKPHEVADWVKKTKESILTAPEDKQKFDKIVNDRLTRGPDALPLDVLDKLATSGPRLQVPGGAGYVV